MSPPIAESGELLSKPCFYQAMILRVSDDVFFDRIIVDGDLNLAAAQDLLAAIRETAVDKDLVIDISGVTSLNFAGLQLLAAVVRDFRRGSRLLALMPAPPACEDVIKRAGLKAFLYADDDKKGNGGDPAKDTDGFGGEELWI